jgi:hypothetical protein
MLITHRFGSTDAFCRARYWLTKNGFAPEIREASPEAAPSLTMKVDFAQASAAIALMNSLDRAEADGWPGVSTTHARWMDDPFTVANDSPSTSSASPIAWNGREPAAFIDPSARAVSDYMFSRWE